MCRIAGYTGPIISLHRFLMEADHSLYRQSWLARELQRATVNADGYGIAWHLDDGSPALYRIPSPIWADTNLPSLTRSLHSRSWIGNVRSATDGLNIQLQNTQPFIDDRWAFTHNGKLGNFSRGIRRRMQSELDDDIEAGIQGNTDSEHLFAVLRQQRKAGHTPLQAFRHAITMLTRWLDDAEQPALLNMIVSDGNSLHTVRHAHRADCPSLYYAVDHPLFRQSVIVASEAFDDENCWQEVPAGHMLSLQPGQTPKPEAL